MSQPIQNQSELEDTGERMVPEYHKSNMIYGEHIVRYEATRQLVNDKVVLDIACGSGYGTALMAKTAKQVIGVDISQEAIAYAKKHYTAENTRYLKGDGVSIPLEDDSVDVVVSFETIEHIKDYKTFLKEVKRVLKSDGLFILSTPNDLEFAEGNQFHVHEFVQAELEAVLRDYFKNQKTYYQATWLYNALINKKTLSSEGRSAIDTINAAPLATAKATYFFLVCSNREITEEVPAIGAISQHWSARQFHEDYEAAHEKLSGMTETIDRLEQHLAESEHELSINRNQASTYLAELESIRASKTWRYAQKAARLKNIVRKNKKSKD